jgi:integral membrane protein
MVAHLRYHFHMTKNPLQQFEAARPFTENEAWLLFRIAAIAEAVGWTILIAGILIERYITPGNNAAVLIAGQTHGMIFFGYLVAALGLYPSLGWSRFRALCALAISVPPYGTLLFEQWAAHMRRTQKLREYRSLLAYSALVS